MCCLAGVASVLAAAMCQVAFRAPGFAQRLCGGYERGALVASPSCVRVQSHAACRFALGAVGCRVFLLFHGFSVRWVLSATSGYFGFC